MAETNTAALRAQGERDARALTVTGRRRADTGRIRRAGKALARMARAVTPETPNGQWLRDNRSFACAAAGDAVAALRHARVRASGGQTALGACCAGLLRACGGALTVKAAEAYLEGFQDALPLETAELALLVPGLQAAVVCALAESYAGDGAAAPALFTSLRALGTAAWGMLAERCDRVGRILARDPVGVYPAMDAATRAHYRQTVARLARRTGRTEIEIAEDVLARAQRSEGARRHVGWFLLREVLGAPERRRDGGWYIAAVVVGTLFLSLLLGFATKSVSGAVLLLIPVSEVVKGLLDAVLLRVTKPRFVPRLALRRGIPPEGRTLCVIAALLTSPEDAHALCARLEEYYLCNRDALGQLTFGLLADLPEADMAHAPIDPAILRGDRDAQRALGQPVLSLHTPSRTDPRREMERVGAQARRITGAGAAGTRPAGRAAVRRRGRGGPERHGIPADARRRHAPDARRGARARGRDAPPAQPRRGGRAARRGHARLRPAAPAHGHRAAERERHGLGARVRRAGRRRPLRRRVRGAVYGLL